MASKPTSQVRTMPGLYRRCVLMLPQFDLAPLEANPALPTLLETLEDLL